MDKIAFTYGEFDCLNKHHFHLIKEMRKIILPDVFVNAVIADDYPAFVNNGCFPIQDLQHRINNLSYLCKNIHVSYSANPSAVFQSMIDEAIKKGQKLVYVGYEDNKEFPGRELLKKHNIPVRFIKRYGTKEA